MDLLRGELVRDGRSVRLSTRELELLTYLAMRSDRAISREELLTEVWEHHPDSLSRAVDKTMTRLRAKLEVDPAAPDHLVTVFGEGYRFVPRVKTAEFPLVGSPTNLPAPIDRFVGRDDLLAAVDAAFGEGRRLVTLLGLGGIGKTRTALRYSQRQVDRGEMRGGIWLVDLTAAATADDLVREVSQALGLGVPPGTPDAVAQVGRAAAARGELLLLLDNLDDVAEAAAEPILAWLRAAPDLRLLGTSRRALHGAGEHVIEVGPLPADDASKLYADRAAAAGGRRGAEGGAALVERLQGIPLAIELAATRARVSLPSELADDLDSLLDLEGPAGGSPRHTSLREVLGASWQRLPPALAESLRACALFEGGFDRAAADEVFAIEDRSATQDVLAQLRDRSLLRAWIPDGAPGWRFGLFPVVRQFVVEAEAAPEGAEERHARWYLRLAERLLPATRRAGAERARRKLAVERANLLAVAERFAQTRPGWVARAVLSVDPVNTTRAPTEGDLVRLETALKQAIAAGDAALELEVRAALGSALWGRGRRAESDAALQGADLKADPAGAVRVLGRLAVNRMYAGDSPGAREILDRSLAMLEPLDLPLEEADALGQIGVGLNRQGRPRDALPFMGGRSPSSSPRTTSCGSARG